MVTAVLTPHPCGRLCAPSKDPPSEWASSLLKWDWLADGVPRIICIAVGQVSRRRAQGISLDGRSTATAYISCSRPEVCALPIPDSVAAAVGLVEVQVWITTRSRRGDTGGENRRRRERARDGDEAPVGGELHACKCVRGRVAGDLAQRQVASLWSGVVLRRLGGGVAYSDRKMLIPLHLVLPAAVDLQHDLIAFEDHVS